MGSAGFISSTVVSTITRIITMIMIIVAAVIRIYQSDNSSDKGGLYMVRKSLQHRVV